ncbi:SHOCT domain-containing protein [Aporhodopirellula aestuarii]|uniref:SHOCT domain-containing protein n=1 Tax=Aporhodopirellula aestuarii TaxID=2950107 RepID=A0ABT0U8D7_9BACT|nr:SHOCT domain-containing protein [Aporhodopirellula aestuarii]MCM2373213.1 SHOCT domain-containing protein [Aporhodopirellula aestuarii]
MLSLSDSGRQTVNDLASRYGISPDGVTHMLIAVHNGRGTMAQFSHPDFGGSGQWMQGGMTMVSDLFNYNLKNLVNNLCSELSTILANNQHGTFSGSFQSQSQNGFDSQAQTAGNCGVTNSLFVPDPAAQWWPPHLGTPSATGNQNQTKYAYFADSHRLAVTTGGPAWVYDTLDHQIGGFGQQQGGGASITFTSQYGTVDLASLPVVWKDGAPFTTAPQSVPQPVEPTPPAAPQENFNPSPSNGNGSNGISDDVFDRLERLAQLKEKGILTEDEFNATKSALLSKIGSR